MYRQRHKLTIFQKRDILHILYYIHVIMCVFITPLASLQIQAILQFFIDGVNVFLKCLGFVIFFKPFNYLFTHLPISTGNNGYFFFKRMFEIKIFYK